jgi:hypothetical protein
MEHRHGNDLPHEPQGTTVVSRRPREIVKAIRVVGQRGLEESQGVESFRGQRVDEARSQAPPHAIVIAR